MTATPQQDGITAGERRELRSVVKGQFKVLRAEVKRREQEMRAEVESQLLDRYRDEDAAIAESQREVARIIADAARAAQEVGQRLQEAFPDLEVEAGYSRFGGISLAAGNSKRSQLHRALIAAIPNKVGDAALTLDRQEMDLLRQLSVGALETDDARSYLDTIPTVGELIPAVRLRELEAALDVTDLP